MSRAWLVEWWRLGAVLAVAVVVGAVSGHVAGAIVFALGGYLAWLLHQLYRLERWLRDGRRHAPPDADGIWAEIFHHHHRLQKRNLARKRRLAALVREFRESTAAIPDGAVALGPRWEIVWFNDAAARLLALSPRDVGQHLTNLVRTPPFVEYLARGDFRLPVGIQAPGDARIRLSMQLVPYGADNHLLLARDLTRLYRLERARREFIANASHELRTPLTVVAGYLETLLDDPATGAGEIGRALQQMRAQTARMQRIVDDLLELSRLESEDAEAPRVPVDARAVLERVCAEARPLRKPGQTLACALDVPVTLLGAEKELHSLVQNLVGNALAYTPEGGSVSVRLSTDADGARIAVSDSGIGIAAEHLPRLTERFYRVDAGRARKDGGTGLGLSIVKHILMRHGGRLEVESVVGRGSVFTAVFPPDRVTNASPDGHPAVTDDAQHSRHQ